MRSTSGGRPDRPRRPARRRRRPSSGFSEAPFSPANRSTTTGLRRRGQRAEGSGGCPARRGPAGGRRDLGPGRRGPPHHHAERHHRHRHVRHRRRPGRQRRTALGGQRTGDRDQRQDRWHHLLRRQPAHHAHARRREGRHRAARCRLRRRLRRGRGGARRIGDMRGRRRSAARVHRSVRPASGRCGLRGRRLEAGAAAGPQPDRRGPGAGGVGRQGVLPGRCRPSPIGVGDLLTTSSTPGHAMRAADPARAFGAVLGKSLGRLTGGQGLVPVLVALQ